uniref:Uncharacterized protein n=1 Tax=Zea mays TaxID=4577 RepID=A0A804Q0V3_MAIZE
PGQAEVSDARLVTLPKEDVLGLDVAVDDPRHAVVVEVREALGDTDGDREPHLPLNHGGAGRASAVEQVAEGAVREVVVEQEARAAVGRPPQQPDDIAVAHPGEHAHLARERLGGRLVARPELLHGDGDAARREVRPVHRAGPPLADHVRGRQAARHVRDADLQLLVQRHVPRRRHVAVLVPAAGARGAPVPPDENERRGHEEHDEGRQQHGHRHARRVARVALAVASVARAPGEAQRRIALDVARGKLCEERRLRQPTGEAVEGYVEGHEVLERGQRLEITGQLVMRHVEHPEPHKPSELRRDCAGETVAAEVKSNLQPRDLAYAPRNLARK